MLQVDCDDVQKSLALSNKENIDALLYLKSQQPKNMEYDIFTDMINMLLGKDNNTTCVWNACDPYTTRAVQGIEGFGQRSNCGRTNRSGIDYVKADQPGFERYIALYHTPQEYEGCQGCRFFLMCKGQCPGTAVDSDWRNRSEHCEIWMTLFRHFEDELLNKGASPISAQVVRFELEQYMLDGWENNDNRSMQHYLEARNWFSTDVMDKNKCGFNSHGDQHGDHYDAGGMNNGEGNG